MNRGTLAPRRRWGRTPGRAALGLCLSAALSACGGSSAKADAAIACRAAKKSIAMLSAGAAQQPSPARAASALAELRSGLPAAARAASISARYAPLAATMSESNRVPEYRLVHALEAECAPRAPTNFPTPQS